MSKPTYEEVVQKLNQEGVPYNSNTVREMCSCNKPNYQASIGKYSIESFGDSCGCGSGKAPLPHKFDCGCGNGNGKASLPQKFSTYGFK